MITRNRVISRLTLKIFAVNGLALVMLAFGLFYLGQYENNLIKTEQKTLERQAHIYAGAIAETAQVRGPMIRRGERGARILKFDRLARFPARKMIRRLGQTTTSRIRLYDFDGQIMGDSDWLAGPVGVIETGPSSHRTRFLKMPVTASLDFIVDVLPSSLNLDYYPTQEKTSMTGFMYPDVQNALANMPSASAWWKNDMEGKKNMVLSAAVPVKSMKGVIGVVYLTRSGEGIINAMRQVQRDILMIFLISLGFTFLLSLYLSGAIARPLKKLSRSAERVQNNFGRGEKIPDLSKRNDEIGDLSLSLKSMTDALSLRLDIIESFAADVAHEIKNPLTSLRSAVETLSIIKSDDDRKRLMSVILHDVNRLDRLITDISKSSRLDAELSREDLEHVDLRPMLESMAQYYNAGLSLPVNMNIGVNGVESRLGQVFDNLLSNAQSFSDTIKISAEKQGRSWHITIKDNGGGIPENKLDAIFNRFYSERPTSERFGEHSGLGLAICKQIIEAHDGEIYADNIMDENQNKIGAQFTVIMRSV